MSQDIQQQLDTLEQAGASFERITTSASKSFEINGIPVSTATKEGVKYEWTLPRDSGIKASFTQESLGKKFLKVFTSELQTGDSIFDDVVYVSTKTKDQTAEFLSNESRREILADVVSRGGVVSLDGTRISYAIIEDLDPIEQQELKMCAFITSLL